MRRWSGKRGRQDQISDISPMAQRGERLAGVLPGRWNNACSCHSPARQHGNESGMTLLELMFAAGVLAVTLALFFQSLINITAADELNNERVVARTHATSIFEDLRGRVYAQFLAYTPPTFPNAMRNETVSLLCTQADGTTVSLPASASLVLPNPVTLQCTVTWLDTVGHSMSQTFSQQFRR